jgi:putative ABC transport system permease protein
MFIAVRDLAFARGRFLLMGLVVALVAFLMTLLTGLSAGLVKNNISGLMELPVTHVSFEDNDKPSYRNTLVERFMWEGWAAQDGVLATEPLGHTVFIARDPRNQPHELALWGVEPGSFLDPGTGTGRALGATGNGVVISRMLADAGVAIGDTLMLERVLTELEVIGVIEEERNIGHIPVVYTPLRKWQEATYGPPGGAPPGEQLPSILFDFASVIALQLAPGVDIAAIDEELGTVTLGKQKSYEASVGYLEEIRTVQLIQGSLVIIAAVVIGAFFTIWTIQRTQEIGLVKALGASSGYLLRDSLGQSLILILVAVAIGLGAGLWTGRLLLDSGLPFMFQAGTVGGAMLLLVLSGLVGGAISVRLITSVDPIIALGRDR